MPSTKPPVQIHQDLPFHRRQWMIQRSGWVLGAAVLVLAIGGLFGGGPLSHVRAGPSSLRVEYERFIRRDTPTEIRINVQPAASEEVQLAFSREYLHALDIESMLPTPERTGSTNQEVVFSFRVEPKAESALITINATPLHAGKLRGRIRALGGPTQPVVPIDQFTWP
jgi:hypothetical protein